MGDRRARAFEPDLVHRLAELQRGPRPSRSPAALAPISSTPEPVERPVLEQRERGIERRLPAHRRKQRVGPLLLEDLGDDLRRDRLDIGRVGELRIGHDRRRVRIDDDHAIAFGFQRLDGLASRIIELAAWPMTIGPAPMIRIEEMSVRLGISSCGPGGLAALTALMMTSVRWFAPRPLVDAVTLLRAWVAYAVEMNSRRFSSLLSWTTLAKRRGRRSAPTSVELRPRVCELRGCAGGRASCRRSRKANEQGLSAHRIAPTNFSNR